MTIRTTLLAATIGIAALTNPLQAGGPVIIEDPAEAAPMSQNNRKIGGLVIGIIAIAALIAMANGDNCNTPDPEPTPGPGGC